LGQKKLRKGEGEKIKSSGGGGGGGGGVGVGGGGGGGGGGGVSGAVGGVNVLVAKGKKKHRSQYRKNGKEKKNGGS